MSVFDISSKYMRSSGQYNSGKRFNYLTMHSGGGELYKVDIQSSSTKLELSSKIIVSEEERKEKNLVLKEFEQNSRSCFAENTLRRVF